MKQIYVTLALLTAIAVPFSASAEKLDNLDCSGFAPSWNIKVRGNQLTVDWLDGKAPRPMTIARRFASSRSNLIGLHLTGGNRAILSRGQCFYSGSAKAYRIGVTLWTAGDKIVTGCCWKPKKAKG